MTLNDPSSALTLLTTRRSASVKSMAEPGPSPEQITQILQIGVRVPDHGRLSPWRFILFEGQARADFGQIIRQRWHRLHPDHNSESLDFMASMFLRAPLIISVIFSPKISAKIPEYEQLLSAACVCQNILLAATSLGIGCQWNSDWIAYDDEIAHSLGLTQAEKIVGFIYLGTATTPYTERLRPNLDALVTRWNAAQ